MSQATAFAASEARKRVFKLVLSYLMSESVCQNISTSLELKKAGHNKHKSSTV